MPLLEQVLKKYPDTVKLVFKNFPIQRHKFSKKAAVAGLAAHSFGKFWEYHDRLFAKDVYNKLSDNKFVEIAGALGIDRQSFGKKVKDPKILAKVRRDSLDGRRAGVKGTPTIFINGKLLNNRTLQGFQLKIDKELAALKQNLK